MNARSNVTLAVVHGARLGGGATNTLPADVQAPSLADLLPYAPRVDRADFSAWTCNDTCPQQRINYP